VKNDDGFITAATSLTKLVYYDYKTRMTKVIPEEARKTIAKFEGIDN